jgi:gamma-glutamyltranspeptidase/glutathione hydrolase
MRYIFKTSVVISFLLLSLSCDITHREKVYRSGAVVSSDRIASEAGLRILREGGNAIDAACATALALAVTYPKAGNIGGGGFALIYSADSQKVFYLDFRETAPAGATAEFYLNENGSVDRDKALYGPSASGTPGTIAGLFEMHRKFGKKQWQNMVHPARMLADTGFIVDENLAASLAEHADRLRKFPATEAVFFPDGKNPKAGDRLIQADLGGTLTAVEVHGGNGFYRGETAQKIADYCADSGGLITMKDLEEYEPIWRDPVSFRFRRLDIYCAGLPSSGGIVAGQILEMLEPFELEKYTADSPEYMHLFIEAARRAYADRAEYLGDPAFTPDLTEALLEESYITNRCKSIDPNRASSSEDVLPGMPKGRRESDQTTHLVTADSSGNIVSLTYTINLCYGCGAVAPGCGFLLNNEMDDFAIKPGEPNVFGLVGSEANKIEPGKRMLSSMMPTIIFESGQPYMALGSPGGAKIITAMAQTIINHRVYGMTVAEAVSAPRFHHQWLPDKVFLERDGYNINIVQKLISMGHFVEERMPYCEVMALGFSQGGVFITGVADPRGPGYVAGF